MVRKLFAHLDHKDRGKDQKDLKLAVSRSIHSAKPLTGRAGLSHTVYLRTGSSVHPECLSASARVLKNGSNGREKMGITSLCCGRPKADDYVSVLVHDRRPDVKSLITHLRTHSTYFPSFEDPFLKMTTNYYTDESARLMKALKSDPAEFMKRCLDRVKQEVDRAKEMFIEDSWKKVRAACEMALFESSHSWVAIDGTFCQSILSIHLI